jgi:hypothetical protein
MCFLILTVTLIRILPTLLKGLIRIVAYHLKGRLPSISINLLANSILSVLLLAHHYLPMNYSTENWHGASSTHKDLARSRSNVAFDE